jgi:hypothetical protein
MSEITTQILLSNASADTIGEAVKANAYYHRLSNYSTLNVDLSTLDANTQIQCTLNTNPNEDDWFDVTPTLITDGTQSYVIKGNFVWARAVVTDYVAGTINSITLEY